MSIALSPPELPLSPYGSAKVQILGTCAYCGEEIVRYDNEEDYCYQLDGHLLHSGRCVRRYVEDNYRKYMYEF